MLINRKIVNKYNRLFKEVAVYYDVPLLMTKGIMDLNVIYGEVLGYGDATIRNKEEYKKFIDWLETKYKYFVPFYRFYLTIPKHSHIEFEYNMFEEMNKVIEKIREVNTTKTGKTNERNS